MRNVMSCAVVTTIALSGAGAGAQTREVPSSALSQLQVRQLKESRYQIGQMERVLEGAVEHGAAVMRDRLRLVLPTDMLLTESAKARGFRLEGYGLFFDVEVPSLEGPLPWSFQSLDQSNLGIQSALQTLRSFIEGAGANDTNVKQALRRVELQVTPVGMTMVNSGGDSKSPAVDAGTPTQEQANQSYRQTISSALIDAMLEHSRGLNLAQGEWLTVAARGADTRARLGVASTESQTWLLSIRGADLSGFLGGQLSHEDAMKRIELRVF